MKPVNVKIAQLREALEAVSAEQIYLKARDQRHRLSELLYLLSLGDLDGLGDWCVCRCKLQSSSCSLCQIKKIYDSQQREDFQYL